MPTPGPQLGEARVDERTKPPFLRRVRIRGYKSIAFCDVALQPLTILVGRNAAGKSNFLDALAFLRDAMNLNVSEAVKRRGGWPALVCRMARVPEIEFDVEAGFDFLGTPLSPEAQSKNDNEREQKQTAIMRYRLRLAAEGADPPAVTKESFDVTLEPPPRPELAELTEGVLDFWRAGGDGLRGKVPRPDRPVISMLGMQPFLGLYEGLGSMGFYNFNPEAIRRLQKPSRGVLLEKDGSNLASVIASLAQGDPAAVERVRDYLALVAEEVAGFEVKTYDEYLGLRFRLRSGPPSELLEFDASSMSDGTLRALAALVAAFQVHRPSGPSVVGIEEPESALHPAAMRALVDALDESTQRTQVLLTTHSADLLSGRDLTPGQVLVVRNRAGQTQITPVDPASREIVEKELYSLADLQRMDRLDLDEVDLRRQAQLSNGAEGT